MASKGKINFDSKHLKKGDPLPPFNGKLRVYSMRFCPFAQRTVLALLAKQVDFENINIDLTNKPEWLTRKSPLGKVPSIEVKEDLCIYESPITVEYIDEAYPQRPLLPKDPVKRAFQKILVEVAGPPIHSIFLKVMKAPETITDEVLASYHSALAFLENHLKSQGTTFLNGNEPGYSDYMIWPWLERFNIMKDYNEKVVIHSDKFPILIKYINNMLKDPVVIQFLVPANIFYEFFRGYAVGKPNYEMLTGY